MRHWALVVMLLVGLAASRAGAATNAAEVELDNSLQTRLVTPHQEWAAHYAGGPIRALFFIYSGNYDGTWADEGTRLREVVELGQRFELQADAVYYGGAGDKWDFHGNALGAERAERLLGQPYALYVIGGFPFDKLPLKMQYDILSQVAKGAGLLCCGPGNEYLTEKRQAALPAALAEALPTVDGKSIAAWATAYRLGQGRGVWLAYPSGALMPTKPFSYRALHEVDYWLLLVGRAAQWAAGLHSDMQLTAVLGREPVHVPAAGGEIGTVVVSSESATPQAGTLALQVRRAEDGLTITLPEVHVAPAAGAPVSVPVTVPRLRAGEYYLNAVVSSARGSEACGAGNLVVESAYGVDTVSVAGTYVERGDTLRGRVTLRGTPPADSVLRLRWRDSFGRVLWQQDSPVEAGRVDYPVAYTPDAFATILMRVEAVLLAGTDEIEMKQASFTVPKRRQGQMNFTMWDTPQEPLGYYVWQQLKEAGFNISLIGSFDDRPTPEVLKACDVSIAPYSTRILDPKDEKGFMLPVCWNDEPAVTDYVQKIVTNQKHHREAGVFVYSLGDEGVTRGCCVSPACIAAYRRWLQGQYGTIAQLNDSWGTTYGSFDAVDLLDHNDSMEGAAQRTNFPRWYDRQAFARYNLAQFSGRFGKAYLGIDPLAKTGFEGTGGFGDDYDAICGANHFYGPYPSLGDDILRSVYPRDRVRSNWMGYAKTGDALSDAAWRMVMKNMDSIWYWMWSGIGAYWGYVRPTFDYWDATADVTREMKPVREGLGDLLLRATPTDSGIAIFYSLPSALAASLENSGSFTEAEKDHQAFTQLTYDLGLDLRYLTDQTLQAGALAQGGFKVLWLPLTQALSAAQAQVIRQFVQDGGTVLADVRPGLYNEHCKPLSAGLLDDVFGVRRAGRGAAVAGPAAVQVELGGTVLHLDLAGAKLDPETQAAGAQALAQAGTTPVVLVNRLGKGQAILLNFAMNLPRLDGPEADQARRLLRALYQVAGVKGVVDIAAPDGGALPLSESRVWRNGDALVFGLWQQMRNAWFAPTSDTTAGAPVPARIRLAAPLHVYDLRAGKYLGKIRHIDTELRWGRANFFAALPYRIGPPRVQLGTARPQPGQPLTVSLAVAVPAAATAQQVVYVEVIDPAGNRPFWGRQPVLLPGGKGSITLLPAFNDQPGRWTVRATELFSGRSAEASWRLR
jgi:hypothetical protein